MGVCGGRLSQGHLRAAENPHDDFTLTVFGKLKDRRHLQGRPVGPRGLLNI